MGKMGWKSITGAVLVGLGYACKAFTGFLPELEKVGDGLVALGVLIGGYGFRSAISKIK